MAAVTVSNLFANVVKDTYLGYIKVVKIGENNAGEERGCDTFTAAEIENLMSKNAKAWWNIGEYWYIVV